jgi:hypothetical protein
MLDIGEPAFAGIGAKLTCVRISSGFAAVVIVSTKKFSAFSVRVPASLSNRNSASSVGRRPDNRRLDQINDLLPASLISTLPFVMVATYAAFLIGIYRGMWRYASVSEVIRVAKEDDLSVFRSCTARRSLAQSRHTRGGRPDGGQDLSAHEI